MEPIASLKIMEGREWIHEIKWDGIRGLSYISRGNLQVFTKHGNERTEFYPELMELQGLLKGSDAVLDGEIVIFENKGNPSFYSSLVRERIRDAKKVRYYSERYPAVYIVFDIMRLNGKDLTHTPLHERKRILEDSLKRSSNITITDPFSAGEDLYALMKAKGWEGIVSKDINSKYISGKTHKSWFKVKLSRKMLAVVGGLWWKDNFPNSLLLGVYKDDSLVYVGSASLGLKQEDVRLLKDYSSSLSQENSPFSKECIPGSLRGVTWFSPLLTCWVQFMEFTADGHLRHPKIIGFSNSQPSEATGKEYII